MERKMTKPILVLDEQQIDETEETRFEEKDCLPLRLSLSPTDQTIEKLVDSLLDEYQATLPKDSRFQNGKYRIALKALTLNLISSGGSLWLKAPGGKDFYRNNRNNTNPLGITAMVMRNLREWLIEANFVEFHPGYYDPTGRNDSFYGRIKPLPKLIEKFSSFLGEDFASSVNFKDARSSYLDLKGTEGNHIDYIPNRATISMNRFLTRYNLLLQKSSVCISGKRLVAPAVYRVFSNGSWKQGGRFYGGHWEVVGGEVRATITINGEEIVECDYSALHPRIIYAEKGIEYQGYPYDVPGVEPAKPLMLMMINSSSRNRARRSFIDDQKEKKSIEYKEKDVDAMMDAVESHHRRIADVFYHKNALRLHYLDSCIAQKVLEHFLDQGVLALPVHDSFLVPKRFESELTKVMIKAYRDVMDPKDIGLTVEVQRKEAS